MTFYDFYHESKPSASHFDYFMRREYRACKGGGGGGKKLSRNCKSTCERRLGVDCVSTRWCQGTKGVGKLGRRTLPF